MKQITVNEAAKIMGKDPHLIRLCLRDKTLTFGFAVKKDGSSRWNYYISPKSFYEYVGEQEETSDDN